MPDFDELESHVSKLQSLLSDRHPGLSSWCSFVGERWQAIAEMWGSEEVLWSRDWPTEPGYYWFYGTWAGPFRYDSLYFVQAIKDEVQGTITAYAGGGGREIFTDCVYGYWMPARVPEPPEQLKEGV